MSVVYQDWTPAGWDKRGKKSTEPREKQVNIARRLGNTVVTTEKCFSLFIQVYSIDDAGKNKSSLNGPVLYARKVEEEDEVFTLPKVDLSFRLRLQKARTEKQMSQKDLAVVLPNNVCDVLEIECEGFCYSRI